MKQKLKTLLHRVWDAFSFIFLVLTFLVISWLLYMYARGYRFSVTDKTIQRTGLLSIESKPTFVNVFVNDEKKGNTPKVVPYVTEGYARVRLEKEGYHQWVKDVPIIAERFSQVSAHLFKVTPEKTELLNVKETVLDTVHTKENDITYVFTKDEAKNTLKIYKLGVSRYFWDFSTNPELIFNSKEYSYKNALVSPNGNSILLYTIKDNEDVSLMIDAQKTTGNYKIFDLAKYPKGTISWLNDSKYLVAKSDTQIVTIDSQTATKTNTYKTITKDTIWTSDNQGHIYVLSENTDKSFRIEQYNTNGTKRNIVEKIYTSTNAEYIANLKTRPLDGESFTNSPESTLFVGKISSFKIDPDNNGIYIVTTQASYWRNSDDGKYVIVYNTPTDLIAHSPNHTMLIFKTPNNEYGIFTYNTENDNPLVEIGTKIILEKALKVDSINWTDKSTLQYTHENYVSVVDTDGANKTDLVKMSDNKYSYGVSNNLENLYTIDFSKNLLIHRYTIK